MASLHVADVTIRARIGWVRVQGRRGKERDVPLPTAARRGLRRYLDGRHSSEPQEPLFLSKRGREISVRAIQHTIQKLARRAGIDRLRVSAQTLRHTFSLHYLEKNPGCLDRLAALLGHESLDSTAIYASPSLDDLTASLERRHMNP